MLYASITCVKCANNGIYAADFYTICNLCLQIVYN
ncbi:MAG: hypothetical protein ACLUVJ_07470 [Lachnospira eligens]